MKMSDAVEVVQVAGAANANKKLGEGWTLLAVVPNSNNAGLAHVAYVLGKSEQDPEKENVPRLKINDAVLANAAQKK